MNEHLKVPWYTGHADGSVTVIEGENETPLPHEVKHSATGFSWGYAGSGPAELARCLLIHALGTKSRCVWCKGTGRIVYGPDGEEYPVEEAESRFEAGDWTESVVTCSHCEDGCAVVPAMYQAFKFEKIARLTMDMPWTMPQSEVLDWWRRYTIGPVADATGGVEIVTPQEYLQMHERQRYDR